MGRDLLAAILAAAAFAAVAMWSAAASPAIAFDGTFPPAPSEVSTLNDVDTLLRPAPRIEERRCGTCRRCRRAGPTRVTKFVSSGAEPNQEIPPDQGRRQLSPAEEGYVEVREEDVPWRLSGGNLRSADGSGRPEF